MAIQINLNKEKAACTIRTSQIKLNLNKENVMDHLLLVCVVLFLLYLVFVILNKVEKINKQEVQLLSLTTVLDIKVKEVECLTAIINNMRRK